MASVAFNPPTKSKFIVRLKLPRLPSDALWTPSEDARLERLAKEHGFRRWHQVALVMPWRSSQECRRRWRDHLARSVYHRPFTARDDTELARLHRRLGGRWHDICKPVCGRTSRVLRRRWKEFRRMGRPQRARPVRVLLPVETSASPPPSQSLPPLPPTVAQRSLNVALASAMCSCSLRSPCMSQNHLDVELASAMSFCGLQ